MSSHLDLKRLWVPCFSATMVQHPYWPVDLVLPGYVPPVKPVHEVLSWFFGVCGVFFAITWFITGKAYVFNLLAGNQPSIPSHLSVAPTRQMLHKRLGAGRYKHLKLGDRIIASWFAMSGVVHFCIEGALQLLHDDQPAADQCQHDSAPASSRSAPPHRLVRPASKLPTGHDWRRPARDMCAWPRPEPCT